MSISGIQGHRLEVTVECCYNLRDTSTTLHDQDPYVRLEYVKTAVKTQACKGEGRNPIFKQKFVFTLVEGHHEMGVAVWNKNTMKTDYLIGTVRVPLDTVLLCGSDDALWPLQFENRPGGQIRLVMNCARAQDTFSYISPTGTSFTASQTDPYMESASTIFLSASAYPSLRPPQPVLVSPITTASFSYTPLPPSAPIRSCSYNATSPPAPNESLSYGPPLPELPTRSFSCNSPSYVAPSYQERKVERREVQKFAEDKAVERKEVESLDPSPNQRRIERREVENFQEDRIVEKVEVKNLVSYSDQARVENVETQIRKTEMRRGSLHQRSCHSAKTSKDEGNTSNSNPKSAIPHVPYHSSPNTKALILLLVSCLLFSTWIYWDRMESSFWDLLNKINNM